MHSFKCSVALAILLFCLQNVEARKCTRKVYTCPETALNITLNDPVAVRRARRAFISDVLDSHIVSTALTVKGRVFVENVLKEVNTDSDTLLGVLYSFAIWTLTLQANALDSPSLCIAASSINASVNWKLTQEGNMSVASLRSAATVTKTVCLMVEVASLFSIGCDNLPELTPLSPRCYKRGTVYELNKALDLFGEYLPCSLLVGSQELYSSSAYSDNALAASLVLSLTPEFQCLVGEANMNVLLEPLYMLLNNNVTVCCCSKRRKRFDTLCSALDTGIGTSIETLIRDVYLFDECSTEAHTTEAYATKARLIDE